MQHHQANLHSPGRHPFAGEIHAHYVLLLADTHHSLPAATRHRLVHRRKKRLSVGAHRLRRQPVDADLRAAHRLEGRPRLRLQRKEPRAHPHQGGGHFPDVNGDLGVPCPANGAHSAPAQGCRVGAQSKVPRHSEDTEAGRRPRPTGTRNPALLHQAGFDPSNILIGFALPVHSVPLTSDRGLWTVDCGLWTMDCGLYRSALLAI